MGEAVRKESSMEDILASIRKIISSGSGESKQTDSDTKASEVTTGSNESNVSTTSSIANPLEDIKIAAKASPEPELAPVLSGITSMRPKSTSSPTSATPLTSAPISKPMPVQTLAPKADEQVEPSLSAFAKQMKSLSSESINAVPKSAEVAADAVQPAPDQLSSEQPVFVEKTTQRNAVTENTVPTKQAITTQTKESNESISASSFQDFAKSVQKPVMPVSKMDTPFPDDVDVFIKEDDTNKSNASLSKLAGSMKSAAAPSVDTQPIETSVAKSEEALVFETAQTKAEDTVSVGSSSVVYPEVLEEPILPKEEKVDMQELTLASTLENQIKSEVAAPILLRSTVDKPVESEVTEVDDFKEALVSLSTKEAVTRSVNRLKKSVTDVNAAHVENVLRPMLREWLDDNLPKMVENIVREEISRITQQTDKA